MEEQEKVLLPVIAIVVGSPATWVTVEIRDANCPTNIIDKWTCAGNAVGFNLSLDSDEYEYKEITLVGPTAFMDGIEEQIRKYYPEVEVCK